MTIRICKDNDTDHADYESYALEEIKSMCKERITLPGWINGYS